MNETRYPLCWPDGWKRVGDERRPRKRAQFGRSETRYDAAQNARMYAGRQRLTVQMAVERVLGEMRSLGVAASAIISTNVRTRNDGLPYSGEKEPADPGAAVYWKKSGKQQCMAIDRYDRVADNLAAIAATLEALRAIERHGGGAILDRAFQGFAQLPAAIVTQRAWRDVLGFHPETKVTVEMMENAFRAKAKERHSDKGGDDDLMRELIEARSAARIELAS